jgi:5-amino-6-(5-phospho-D-ribitylamino)uracil phosphatase
MEVDLHAFKAVAIDLDGTLLTSAEIITKETSEILMKLYRSGILIILASGRSVALQTCFASSLPPVFHVVAFNGGVVAEYRNEQYLIHHTSVLEPSIVLNIVEILQRAAIPFLVYDGEVCCVSTEFLSEAMRREGIPNLKQTPDLSFLAQSRELLKIALPLGRVEPGGASNFEAERAAAELALRGLDLSSMGLQVLHMHDWIDIVPALSGKAAGLRVACARLGVDLGDVLAFGDGGNDLCMLAAAGRSIAPSNASAAAKRAASRVSPWSNDEECVRRELERLRPSLAAAAAAPP